MHFVGNVFQGIEWNHLTITSPEYHVFGYLASWSLVIARSLHQSQRTALHPSSLRPARCLLLPQSAATSSSPSPARLLFAEFDLSPLPLPFCHCLLLFWPSFPIQWRYRSDLPFYGNGVCSYYCIVIEFIFWWQLSLSLHSMSYIELVFRSIDQPNAKSGGVCALRNSFPFGGVPLCHKQLYSFRCNIFQGNEWNHLTIILPRCHLFGHFASWSLVLARSLHQFQRTALLLPQSAAASSSLSPARLLFAGFDLPPPRLHCVPLFFDLFISND